MRTQVYVKFDLQIDNDTLRRNVSEQRMNDCLLRSARNVDWRPFKMTYSFDQVCMAYATTHPGGSELKMSTSFIHHEPELASTVQ